MRILFIGNSYTYYNDLPHIFEKLALDSALDVTVDSVTRGGWFLHKYLDVENEHAAKLRELVSRQHYDVCVLQEQSLAPAIGFPVFQDGVMRITQFLSSAADRFVLYATWGRKEGHPALAEHGLSTVSMMEALEESYCRIGGRIGADVALVGRNFASVQKALPDLELYDPDRTHPSYAGSCVAALTLYRCIFGGLPTDTGSLRLDKADLEAILELVANQRKL